jgi:hypothetical protein
LRKINDDIEEIAPVLAVQGSFCFGKKYVLLDMLFNVSIPSQGLFTAPAVGTLR